MRPGPMRSLAARLPADRLLTETDNPGAWEWMAGEVGFPDLIERVEEALAEIRGVSRAELTEQAEENFTHALRAGGVDVDWV